MLRVIFSAAILAIGAQLVAAVDLQMSCTDGDPNALLQRGGFSETLPFCNHDEAGDGICTFTICDRCAFTRHCVGPSNGVCRAGTVPPRMTIQVPMRKKRVRRIGTTTIRFRCRAGTAVTTTTTLPSVACETPSACMPPECIFAALDCHDGMENTGTGCDLDREVNGTCSFGFYCSELCAPTPLATVTVPVGQSCIVTRGNLPGFSVTQYTLRCLP